MQFQHKRQTTGNDLYTFQLVSDFVTSLYDCFCQTSNKHHALHALSLYNRLIHNMNFKDDVNILRHVNAFRSFCVDNREQIKSRSDVSSRVTFSDKIYIDVSYFIQNADDETRNTIWEYILAIAAYVDPESKAKEILQDLYSTETSSAAPEDMMTQLLKGGGGDLMKLMGGIDIGKVMSQIDLPQLMGSLTTIADTVKNQLENSDDPNLAALTNMLINNNNNKEE